MVLRSPYFTSADDFIRWVCETGLDNTQVRLNCADVRGEGGAGGPVALGSQYGWQVAGTTVHVCTVKKGIKQATFTV